MIVAEVLASAFLEGPWTAETMAARGAASLGKRFRWLGRVAREVIARFPEPPCDGFDDLAALLGVDEAVVRAATKTPLRLRFGHPDIGMREVHPSWRLPRIDTLGDLGAWLELDDTRLEWLADTRGLSRLSRGEKLSHYRCRWLPKRSGGLRLVESPKSELKAIQRRLLHELLDRAPTHPAAQGFVRNRSVLTHAGSHVGKRMVLSMDLEDFFLSVEASRVHAIFRSLGYTRPVARSLTALVTVRSPIVPSASLVPHRTRQRMRTRHLPQGAPTSPALANLCAFGLDVRLTAAAAKINATYTRYADDLVFSAERDLENGFPTLVAAIAIEEGFTVNYRKTRLQRAAQRQMATGIVVNQSPSLPRRDLERLEAILYNCARNGPKTQNRANHPDFKRHLEGRVAWAVHVKPRAAETLAPLLAAIRW